MRFILRLLGYELLDEIVGLWKHSYKNFIGEEVIFADYAKYRIYYNVKKDKYRLFKGGYKPLTHCLNDEIEMMICYLNMKPKNEYQEFFNNKSDYFTAKEFTMTSLRQSEVPEMESNEAGLVIIRFGLDVSREEVFKMHDISPVKKRVLQEFKESKFISRSADVYEEKDNILITSDGYYICTEKDNVKEIEDESED